MHRAKINACHRTIRTKLEADLIHSIKSPSNARVQERERSLKYDFQGVLYKVLIFLARDLRSGTSDDSPKHRVLLLQIFIPLLFARR